MTKLIVTNISIWKKKNTVGCGRNLFKISLFQYYLAVLAVFYKKKLFKNTIGYVYIFFIKPIRVPLGDEIYNL